MAEARVVKSVTITQPYSTCVLCAYLGTHIAPFPLQERRMVVTTTDDRRNRTSALATEPTGRSWCSASDIYLVSLPTANSLLFAFRQHRTLMADDTR